MPRAPGDTETRPDVPKADTLIQVEERSDDALKSVQGRSESIISATPPRKKLRPALERFRFNKPQSKAVDEVSVVAATVDENGVAEPEEENVDLVDMLEEMEREERGESTLSGSFMDPGLKLGASGA